MLEKYQHEGVIWYNFKEMNEEEFWPLVWKYDIDDSIAKKFINGDDFDNTTLLNNDLLLSLSIPNLQNKKYYEQNIKFIVGQKYIISTGIAKNEGVVKFSEELTKNHLLSGAEKHENPTTFLFSLLFQHIYENMIVELKIIKTDINIIEENIFLENETEMVKIISMVNRNLLDFRKYISTHDDSWEVFLKLSKDIFPKPSSQRILEGILLTYKKTADEAKKTQDLLLALRDTNNSLLNAKLGNTSKNFALIAILTLPMSLFVSIVSIPTQQKHLFLGHDQDFTLILVGSAIILISTLIFSKIKKWW